MPDASSIARPSDGDALPDRFQLRDLLTFEKMITPRLAKIGFYIFSVLSILTGAVMMIIGMGTRVGGGMLVASGLFIVLVGPFLVRVACEQIIVIFGIYERLGQIRDRDRSE